jgi:hypothetical protein
MLDERIAIMIVNPAKGARFTSLSQFFLGLNSARLYPQEPLQIG